MKHFEEFQEILCTNGRMLSIGGYIEGVIFDLKDFQKLLTLLAEENDNREETT